MNEWTAFIHVPVTVIGCVIQCRCSSWNTANTACANTCGCPYVHWIKLLAQLAEGAAFWAVAGLVSCASADQQQTPVTMTAVQSVSMTAKASSCHEGQPPALWPSSVHCKKL
jgi:hypothetical protein